MSLNIYRALFGPKQSVLSPLDPEIQNLEIQRTIDKLSDADGNVRISAAWALGEMGEQAEKAVPELIETLNDKHLVVRNTAADALGRIGKKAEAAVPKLVEALSHGKIFVKIATDALENIGEKGAHKAVISELIKAVQEK